MSKKRDFKETFTSPEASILEAMKSIDNAALQIALIVDKGQKLLGTVTDGDVRRAILSNISLEENVAKIMNNNPLTMPQDARIEDVLAMMEERHIQQIPVLDKEGCVIAFETRSSLRSKIEQGSAMESVSVVLMLGGEGKRLQPLTEDLPKPMIQVGDKPLLETILERFVAQGFTQFFFSVNYKAEMIEDHFGGGERFGAQISYLTENKQMGTAGALSLLPEPPSGPLIVMNGDLLTNVNFSHLVDFHNQNKSMATMCVREYTHEVPYGIVQNNGVDLATIVEKPSQSFFVNAGIYVLDPEALGYVPSGQFFDMPQLFEKIGESGKKSSVFPIHEYWLDIGRVEDLERAREEYKQIFG